MSSPACTCAAPARPRTADEINTAIRQLAARAATWTRAELAEYARLSSEYGAARAREVAPAA